ncbi:carbohydrate-binding protein [Streptomyces sp. VRA16 Mangrove soil]|uniref:carbohydrate-binding protein n=1 Tax=Streptomyces sp. VRA16 Mangrove soil TaxID=2817434 RepID=UPI001A9DF033|nr:carbohydrate-binding protein [Streptomyces sp. VRA16 Mangrove soil]MBO1337907.1 carbohydrate-binding protein [Streptomyces sp. VRA16 Mangrove soil]
MAPGNNGASTTPEDDDPFGYLYADGQAAGATPPSGGGGGYGYPNPRSYNQVRAVGERQYGQQQVPPQQTQPTQAYHQPNAHYQAPETMPGGAPTQPTGRAAARGSGGRGSGGPNTKALLIGAVAVVAAVVIGISVAMLSNGSDDDAKGDTAGGQPSSQSARPSESTSPSTSSSADVGELPKTDAKGLTLSGGPVTAADIKGAKAAGGEYVAGFNKVGAKVTWNVSMPKGGAYRLYVRYGIPGVEANATLNVNSKANAQPLGMKNFTSSPKGDWEKGWQSTWAPVTLTKGTNVIELECADGNQCNANIDQLWLQ